MKKISEWKFFAKIKENKKLQNIIVALVILIMVFVFVSMTGIFGGSKKDDTNDGSAFISASDYATMLEQKLVATLGQIKGAGKVSAMVTVDGEGEIEIAYTTEERTNSSSSGSSAASGNSTDSSTIIKTPVLVNKNGVTQPIILSQSYPKIIGVIVVASGADDIRVRMELLKAAQAVLKIDVDMIEIFGGKT